MSGKRAKMIREVCMLKWNKLMTNEERQGWGSFRRYYRNTKRQYRRGQI